MSDHPLENYIATCRASGMSDAEIKDNLLAHGWEERRVQEALIGFAMPSPHRSNLHLASSGLRFMNLLVDSFCAYVFLGIFWFFISASQVLNYNSYASIVFTVFSRFSFLLFIPFYYLFFEGIFQRTPGKFMSGTKVVMEDGSKPDFMHILGRSLVRIIPVDALTFFFSPRGWHDSFSRTLVVPKEYTEQEIKQIQISKTNRMSIMSIIFIIIGTVAVIVGIFIFYVILRYSFI